jgi:hypothetical protein
VRQRVLAPRDAVNDGPAEYLPKPGLQAVSAGEWGAQEDEQHQRCRAPAGKNRVLHRATPNFFRLGGGLGGSLTSR